MPKRVNFISIQNQHTIAAKGYHQPLLRTEYEYIIPYKTGKLYSYMAEQNGKVIELTDKKITIEYDDKSKIALPIGIEHGLAEGTAYPHEIVTDLKLNQKFKTGDPIAYNSNFFERDWLDKSRLILKMSSLVTTALTMNNEVYEDSSAISNKVKDKMSTKITKVKSFIIDFNKNIINVLPVGTHVKPNDILFTIVDETTNLNNLSEDAIKLLSNLANISPKAKIKGIIDKYEINYNGDIKEMSDTLRKIAKQLDIDIQTKTKDTEIEISNNKVESEYRVEGNNLLPDTLELKVYITEDVEANIGDKFVFASQLKSVVGDVFNNDLYTEDGREIMAMFGFKSIANRITLSPFIIGTTNTLLKEVSKQVSELYFN